MQPEIPGENPFLIASTRKVLAKTSPLIAGVVPGLFGLALFLIFALSGKNGEIRQATLGCLALFALAYFVYLFFRMVQLNHRIQTGLADIKTGKSGAEFLNKLYQDGAMRNEYIKSPELREKFMKDYEERYLKKSGPGPSSSTADASKKDGI